MWDIFLTPPLPTTTCYLFQTIFNFSFRLTCIFVFVFHSLSCAFVTIHPNGLFWIIINISLLTFLHWAFVSTLFWILINFSICITCFFVLFLSITFFKLLSWQSDPTVSITSPSTLSSLYSFEKRANFSLEVLLLLFLTFSCQWRIRGAQKN